MANLEASIRAAQATIELDELADVLSNSAQFCDKQYPHTRVYMTGTVTPSSTDAAPSLEPKILRLTIERFRGIEKLDWYPEAGVNIILGGGDVGKTTVLEAIALLFSPTNNVALSDTDYWQREVENGFCIEAVLFLPEAASISQQINHAWPWTWDGKAAVLPVISDDPAAAKQVLDTPVYRVCVRGNSEFDVSHELIQPDGTVDHFSANTRRSIGLVRLSGDDRNDRDLRLVQGSALDRLLSDKTLRARLGAKLAENDVNAELKPDGRTALEELNKQFEKQTLPSGLGLGLNGGQGFSFNALIGLTATKNAKALPFSTWGAGTRRLAALEIAAANQGAHPIMLVDEVERGLEPYRQRTLLDDLHKAGSQVFMTTHSPTVLRAAHDAKLWYVDFNGNIGRLADTVRKHQLEDPETFLSRLAVVAEGKTEKGFLIHLLEQKVGPLLDLGVWVTDGGGNDSTLQLLEDLAKSGLAFSGFADDEGTSPGKWAALKTKLGPLLFRWETGSLEENIFPLVPLEQLEEFIKDSDGESGERLRTLADRLGLTDKTFIAIKTAAPDLLGLIIAAASGTVPEGTDEKKKKEWKKHGSRWFKTLDGGKELAEKVFAFGLWQQLEPQLSPFLAEVRKAVGLPVTPTLP